MAKNYESESKNSRNYTGTSDKNSYGNEMNHAGNAKNSVKAKTRQIVEVKQKIKLPSLTAQKKTDIDWIRRGKCPS